MKFNLKTFQFLVSITAILFTASCIDDNEDTIQRTQADEQAELNQILQNMVQDNVDIDTTNSGVYYVMHETGEGSLVEPYDTVVIEYSGYFTDGTLFDTSSNASPDGKWEFVYMEQSLIQGFNDGLAVMRKGAEVELIIPSSLAYGASGYPPVIGPYQTLVFGVKLHDLRKP